MLSSPMAELHFPADPTPSPLVFTNTEGRDELKKLPEQWYELKPWEGFVIPEIKFPVKVFIRKRLSDYEADFQVYRVVMWRDRDVGKENGEVMGVCKVAMGKKYAERLRKEASFYRGRLAPLQSRVVPGIYGYFESEVTDGLIVGVLAMDDCGEGLSRPLWAYPLDFRVRVVHALHAIHKAGVKHGDFGEDNIVIARHGKNRVFAPRIIDFERASEHECKSTLEEQIKVYRKVPGHTEFGCGELWDGCRHSYIWAPGLIAWYGKTIPMEWATSPEALVEKAGYPEDETKETALDAARRQILTITSDWKARTRFDDAEIDWHD
ncbi:hypothetical protein C8Q74DRAFT_689507 [Fomes fomentarius]|nr:hypothetical protein C8Q74DRAFT_689507 [Fomes fomentarius]